MNHSRSEQFVSADTISVKIQGKDGRDITWSFSAERSRGLGLLIASEVEYDELYFESFTPSYHMSSRRMQFDVRY